MPEREPAPRRGQARRAVLLGAAAVFLGILITLIPLLLGRGSLNRYFVVAGLTGVFVGGSSVINGLWDWLRERRP